MTLSEVELAWLAGLLEGEGSFVAASARATYTVTAQIVMTDLDVIEKVASWWRVCISRPRRLKEHHKQTYRCTLRGQRAVDWMVRLKPLMGARRQEQITRAIASWKPKGQYQKVTTDQARMITARWQAGERAQELAQEFGLTVQGVYALRERAHFTKHGTVAQR